MMADVIHLLNLVLKAKLAICRSAGIKALLAPSKVLIAVGVESCGACQRYILIATVQCVMQMFDMQIVTHLSCTHPLRKALLQLSQRCILLSQHAVHAGLAAGRSFLGNLQLALSQRHCILSSPQQSC